LRGRSRSRPAGEIVAEIEQLVQAGYKEIVLSGVHLGAYGRDRAEANSLSTLVRRVLNETEVARLRLSSLEPWDIPSEFFELWQDERLGRHLHLPLQSGSDRILGLMNRKYTFAHYARLVDAVKKYQPDAAITTDIIVGFPSETEKDFARTLDACRRFQYDDAFMYRYSQRPFTKAANFQDKVPQNVAGRRLEELIELQRNISKNKNQKSIGKTQTVLVERKSKKNPAEMLCKSETGKMIVARTHAPVGFFVRVAITGISGNTLRGEEKGAYKAGNDFPRRLVRVNKGRNHGEKE